MLVTPVIGADDAQCHKNPIVTIVVGYKMFRKVVECSEIRGLPTWKNFPLLQPVSNNLQKDKLIVSTIGSDYASVDTFGDEPHIFMTPAYGCFSTLQF